MPPILRRNLVGGQWARPARTPDVTPPPPPPPPTIASRFPGDTNPKVSGKVIWGLDEFDQDGTLQHASELSRPETTAGGPAGAMRSYFNGAASLGSGGAVRTSIQEQHARGRIAWPSVMYSTSWVQAADGRNNAAYDSFIAWVEETATAPVWFTLIHEPENQARSGVPGSYADWLKVQQNFRARMTAYANAHGGVATYKWRNLAFAPNLTAFAFVGSATKTADIDLFIPAGTAKFWDFMAVDYYIGGQQGAIGSPAWGTNIVRAVAWCKARNAIMAIAEWGVNRDDVDAAAKMQEIWNRTFDGTNDIVAWLYYNSSVGSLSTVEQRWMLTGSLLTKWVALLKDARSVHYWDLKNPATGVAYARPSGIPDPTPPTGNQQVGYIGDSLTYQGASGAPRQALITAGWDAANVRVDGATGRGINPAGVQAGITNPSTIISTWRGEGFDPSTWIFALGSNNFGSSDASITTAINDTLDIIAAGARSSYVVYWVGVALRRTPAPTDPNMTEANVTRLLGLMNAADAANSRPKIDMRVIDFNALIHNGRDETGLWTTAADGRHMTTAGYTVRNSIITNIVTSERLGV